MCPTIHTKTRRRAESRRQESSMRTRLNLLACGFMRCIWRWLEASTKRRSTILRTNLAPSNGTKKGASTGDSTTASEGFGGVTFTPKRGFFVMTALCSSDNCWVGVHVGSIKLAISCSGLWEDQLLSSSKRIGLKKYFNLPIWVPILRHGQG